MQASTARQTPDDLRPRPSNKDKGLGDSIRDLTWLPELCIPSVIIHNYIVCDMVCLPSYWSAGHMAGFFHRGPLRRQAFKGDAHSHATPGTPRAQTWDMDL